MFWISFSQRVQQIRDDCRLIWCGVYRVESIWWLPQSVQSNDHICNALARLLTYACVCVHFLRLILVYLMCFIRCKSLFLLFFFLSFFRSILRRHCLLFFHLFSFFKFSLLLALFRQFDWAQTFRAVTATVYTANSTTLNYRPSTEKYTLSHTKLLIFIYLFDLCFFFLNFQWKFCMRALYVCVVHSLYFSW